MVIDEPISQNQKQPLHIRILEQTPPNADYVWASRRELPEMTMQKIIAAFLNLSRDSAQGKKLLAARGAGANLPTLNSDFDVL